MNTRIYHVAFDSDSEANAACLRAIPAVRAVSGVIGVSESMGHGPSYVVLALPSAADATSIFPDHTVVEVTPLQSVPVMPGGDYVGIE